MTSYNGNLRDLQYNQCTRYIRDYKGKHRVGCKYDYIFLCKKCQCFVFNLFYIFTFSDPACGYYTTLRAGSIVLHDRMFTVGRACYWKVMSIDTNALIQLYVISMNIQYTENCELDYLQVMHKLYFKII